jgi:formate dehydrogenase/bidirectional [NiFe] hydrogenase diaphorase subunit
MIVQELFRLQRENGYIRKEALGALSETTGVPLFRLQEVVSFFPHFRTTPPPRIEVHVCRDMACRLRGSCELEEAARRVASNSAGEMQVHPVSCLGRCDRAPAAMINEKLYLSRKPDDFGDLLGNLAAYLPDHDADLPRQTKEAWTIDVYDGKPRYQAVRDYVDKKPADARQVITALETAGLLGMGGAGGRAYKKWEDVQRAEGDQKYVVCNADESEPGTFKDRELLLRTPWLVLEGMILGGLVVGATRGYVYIRHEYEEQILAVQEAIDHARQIGACGDSIFGSVFNFELEIFVSPGGYICGEQTALIEAMEDHRAEPRNRPPQLQTNGLWDKPTLLSNVETFAWVPAILLKDEGRWFANAGRTGMKGRRFFSISGDVNKPGVYEVPNGITLRELIDDHAGGMRHGKPIKAVAPSGPSGGLLPVKLPVAALQRRFAETLPQGTTHYDLLDWPLDIAASRSMDLMLGAGIVVYAQDADMIDQAWACSQFYRDESCGKCVPCRIGSHKLTEILASIKNRQFRVSELGDTRQVVEELAATMSLTSICGLGQVAPAPILSLLQYFVDDVIRHLAADEQGRLLPVS